MSKRGSTTDLNHDNWDREEEPEEPGTFRRAAEDQMKGRVIKKARRRNLANGVSGVTDQSCWHFRYFFIFSIIKDFLHFLSS